MNDHARRLRAFLDGRYEALITGRRPLSWSAWIASAAVLAGCGARTDPLQMPAEDETSTPDGASAEDCGNLVDDDGDGQVDCLDVDCASSVACGARYGIPYDGG